ncbi:MAG: hypothetical protein IPP14_09795 [Planctomycetes bacterium]|nr:hypothetical protein [Planctomycetota bacterium]
MALAAQADGQAKRILDQPSYKGYRIDKVPVSEQGGSGDDWEGRTDGSDQPSKGQPSDGEASEEPTYKRGESTGPRRGNQADGRRAPREKSSGSSDSSPDFSGMAWVGQVFEVVVWIVLAVAVAAGLFFLVKAILGIKFDKKKAKKTKAKRAKKASVETTTPESPLPDVPQEVFVDALAAAQREYDQAVQAQDWSRAALLAYRIFWLRAGWSGCVESTDVRTWRDAVRLVKGVETRQQVRGLLRLIENVRYGAHAPDRQEFTTWRAELDALNPREVLK